MPWESQQTGPPPQRPAPQPPGQVVYQAPQQPYTYVPAPVPPSQPPPPQVVAVNDQTGQRVPVDLNSVIQQAINTAIVENKQHVVDRAQSTQKRLAAPKKEFKDETVEEAFQSGQVTVLTFVRGISLDIGVSLVAAFATIADGPGFSVFDKEIWTTIIPALVAKTVVQTGMSFMMKAKMK